MQNEDVVYPAYQAGQELPLALERIKDIQVTDASWTDAELSEFGIPGFNAVGPSTGREGCHDSRGSPASMARAGPWPLQGSLLPGGAGRQLPG